MCRYGIRITYSWGEKEPVIECATLEDAWRKAREDALTEAETASEGHGCEVGLEFKHSEGRITLHYTYDDEYCYYNIVKL